MERVVDLGRLDFVLHVDSVEKSQRFYELLGFQVVEISEASAYGDRVAVVEHELLRLHLAEGWFGERHARPETWCGGGRMCFRPADISGALPTLQQRFDGRGEVVAGGKAFDIQDPDGNVIYIWEDVSSADEHTAAGQGAGPEDALDLGRLDIILNVQSADASIEFYEKLGFRHLESARRERLAEVEHEQVDLLLMERWIGANMFNFIVADMSDTLPELTERFDDRVVAELGLPRAGEVMHGGKAFDIADPDGNDIYFREED